MCIPINSRTAVGDGAAPSRRHPPVHPDWRVHVRVSIHLHLLRLLQHPMLHLRVHVHWHADPRATTYSCRVLDGIQSHFTMTRALTITHAQC